MDKFVEGYIECALWAEEESLSEGNEDADINLYNIHPDSLAQMEADCKSFREQAGDLLEEWSDEQAGHDFWLTRNGHGTGFWDRGMADKPTRDALTKLSQDMGSCDLYLGDDGKIYTT
jgi:hypothetical protein